MEMGKIFTCQECDANIEVEDVFNTDSVVCHNCGQTYTLRWVEREKAYDLLPVEAVEPEARNRAGKEEDEPFRVLNEPAGPREDDLDRY